MNSEDTRRKLCLSSEPIRGLQAASRAEVPSSPLATGASLMTEVHIFESWQCGATSFSSMGKRGSGQRQTLEGLRRSPALNSDNTPALEGPAGPLGQQVLRDVPRGASWVRTGRGGRRGSAWPRAPAMQIGKVDSAPKSVFPGCYGVFGRHRRVW